MTKPGQSKNHLYNRERYRQKIEANRCGNCGQPIPQQLGAKRTCDKCLTVTKHSGQRARAERRLAGLCPQCGGAPAPNRKLCSECLARAKQRFQSRKAAGVCTKCGVWANCPGRALCMFCKENDKRRLPDWRDRLIVEVMNAYGGCVCRCCGTTDFAFLTLDHIGGGGNQHRQQLRKQKITDIYTWVKKKGFPPGYQVLCMNCNWARGKYGECPHQTRGCLPLTYCG